MKEIRITGWTSSIPSINEKDKNNWTHSLPLIHNSFTQCKIFAFTVENTWCSLKSQYQAF